MEQLKTSIDPKSKDFIENYNFMQSLVEENKDILKKTKKMPLNQKKFPEALRRKKRPVREKIAFLLDKGSQFLELSPLAAWNMYENEIPSAGIVTGIGRIQNQECMIIANNFLVKGGCYFPMTVKKHLRAQEIALENKLPCIYLVDSGGAYLPLQAEIFPDKEHFGRIFYNQARMSKKGIPQISVVFGHSIAGGAYLPALSEENIIVKNQGCVFLGGPQLVKAATGEEVEAEDLGGAKMHSEISGLLDHVVESETEALEKVRDIVSYLKRKKEPLLDRNKRKEPLYPIHEIYGILPKDFKKSYEVKEVIARLVDGSEFHEFKASYAKTLVTGFAYLWGYPIGIVANNGVLMSESGLKATHFIELCNQRQIPLIFLQNVTGFMVGKKYEQEGIAKHGAKMVMAVSNAEVPCFTVIIGGSYGAGNYGMCGRAFGPKLLWMWPNARISVMGGKQASLVLYELENKKRLRSGILPINEEEEERTKKALLAQYTKESSAYYSTARLWDDGIIDPVDTRKFLALALAMSLKSFDEKVRHKKEGKKAIFRM